MNKQMEFKKWQKIGQFHNTRKSINEIVDYKQSVGETIGFPVVSYKGKIKLDGTNAAIRVAGGQVAAQSRSRLISVEDDNYGFAVFVTGLEDWALRVAGKANEITIYGEWCGQGIQKRCSVAKCTKMFVVFSACVDDRRIECPAELRELLGEVPPDVYILNWYGESIVVDYSCDKSIDAAINTMCEAVAVVEACDPWVQELFGHEGLGEGIVYYPFAVAKAACLPDDIDLMFKAKGEEHKNVIQLKPVIKAPEVVASVAAFVVKFVTEARLEQGLVELKLSDPSRKDTGSFLKWVGNDVKSESSDELEAAGLNWGVVAKPVAQAAKSWLFARV